MNELVCELEVLDERCKHLKSKEMKFKRLELALEKRCKDLELMVKEEKCKELESELKEVNVKLRAQDHMETELTALKKLSLEGERIS